MFVNWKAIVIKNWALGAVENPANKLGSLSPFLLLLPSFILSLKEHIVFIWLKKIV